MPTYDLKCSFCGYEADIMLPISRDLNDTPLGCLNPEVKNCAGLMEKTYRFPPSLHPKATPSRTRNDGVSYRESEFTGEHAEKTE
jgi:hypothetical protein